MSQPFPPIPEVLLKELEKRFPPSYPDLSLSERELWSKAGEGRIINFLRHQYEEQTRTRMKRSP